MKSPKSHAEEITYLKGYLRGLKEADELSGDGPTADTTLRGLIANTRNWLEDLMKREEER